LDAWGIGGTLVRRGSRTACAKPTVFDVGDLRKGERLFSPMPLPAYVVHADYFVRLPPAQTSPGADRGVRQACLRYGDIDAIHLREKHKPADLATVISRVADTLPLGAPT
jgi:hypothetical protein